MAHKRKTSLTGKEWYAKLPTLISTDQKSRIYEHWARISLLKMDSGEIEKQRSIDSYTIKTLTSLCLYWLYCCIVIPKHITKVRFKIKLSNQKVFFDVNAVVIKIAIKIISGTQSSSCTHYYWLMTALGNKRVHAKVMPWNCGNHKIHK